MSLKRTINKLDDVAEGLREFYTLQDDGSYSLDAEQGDDAGVKSALEKERADATKYRQELNKVRDKYKGIDLEVYMKLQEDAEAAKKKELLDAGQVDQVIAERMAKARAEWDEEKTVLTNKAGTLRTQLHKELIGNRLTDLCVKLGVRPSAYGDVRARGDKLFRINEETGSIEAWDGEKLVYGKDPTCSLQPDEWLKDVEKKGDDPHLFLSSSGGQVPPGGGAPGGGERFTLSREQAGNVATYRAMKDQAAKVGQKVVIQTE
jgi:hypothetical protein